jgi:hypothetical protein
MKFAVLLPIAALTAALLTACSSTSTGSAVPLAGAPQIAGAGIERNATASSAIVPQIFVNVQRFQPKLEDWSSHVLAFGGGASGNAAPLSSLKGAFLAVTAQRNLWVGTAVPDRFALYSATGTLLRTVTLGAPAALGSSTGSAAFAIDAQRNFYLVWGQTPSLRDGCMFDGDVVIARYPPSGGKLPTQILDLGSQCVVPIITFDGLGHLYVAEEQIMGGLGPPLTGARIAVYAPGASGSAKPVRSIVVPVDDQDYRYGIYQLAGDAAGDLFMDYQTQLYEFPHDRPTWQHRIMPSVAAQAFAIDGRGNIYVANGFTNPHGTVPRQPAIQVYALGATTPARTIAGNDTQMGARHSSTNFFGMAVVP